ncbi:GntR family transcriptional regulator [Mycobacterium sp. 236(2023)]|uniref:GntR family transcriptional regulator n=1 Tax=Mycobacterium sp. 236(2023) TaxID=3038163 RepID=UPI00241509EB|nr:GntR family transcriptional regulator [Mycobacterium sp. 236(2023)]MDG4667189.1 GntR family transcriptional regulator [Mycobacterium sp. 236(2023)]
MSTSQARSLWAYDEIKKMIIDGDLRPGDELRERDLAEKLGVSRVPVREALPMLERAGLAQLSPRRTARVTQISESDVTDHFQVRTALEPLAARLAAERVVRGADPAALARALAAAHGALTSDDDKGFHESSSLLHVEIERLAANPLLDEVMGVLRERRARLNSLDPGGHAQERHQEHIVVVDAIAHGNVRLAEVSSLTHVELGHARTSRALRERGSRPVSDANEMRRC